MKTPSRLATLLGLLSLFPCWPVSAASLLVWPGSPTPGGPFTNWSTAAHSIQDAVDAAQAGDTILVTNGLYATGGRAAVGTITNRVAVTKRLRIQSVNGPEVTVIQGSQVPGTTNGDGAVRCVYLVDGAVLSGFNLTNGATRTAGDAGWEQSGGGVLCEFTNALITNCIITGNSAAKNGGGAYGGRLDNCTLTRNLARAGGGGASSATLNHCTLTGNYALTGGGVFYGTLNNCAFTANWATNGGAACYGTLNNCTLAWNSAQSGGGAYSATNNNCILYYNTAVNGANYYYNSRLNFCCTTPDPGSGAGNITAAPQLFGTFHLSQASPCRGAGSAAYATGVDLDGESWLSPPSIGCDEYRPGAVTGPLTVAIRASWTNVAPGVAVDLTALITGRGTAYVWDFGDGMVLSNQFYLSRTWSAVGTYPVVLRAYNDSHPEGVSATATITVAEVVHYVSAASPNPVPPYNSWDTAAQSIQAAVDAVTVPGALLLVTNGVYATGGRAVYGTMTNRVAVDRLVTVRSVNGPEVTVIQGYQVPGTTNGDGAIRCVYLTNGAVLSGFTLTNGATGQSGDTILGRSGGGVWCESTNALATNCVLAGNWAAQGGGGAYSGTLWNCIVSRNWAQSAGGGACYGTRYNCAFTGNSAFGDGGAVCHETLNNCTLTGNSVFGPYRGGGGAYGCTLNNCILYSNMVVTFAPNYYACALYSCCTTPLPAGNGNFEAEPQLADAFHLSPGSPCRGAGSGAYATGVDIDGDTWLNPPSIGCDEYHAESVTGPLAVAITTRWTNVAVGSPLALTAVVSGRLTVSAWDFADGSVVSNRLRATHAWAEVGDYPVVVRVYNQSHLEGVSATAMIRVLPQAVYYVAANSTNPIPPYSSWTTAAQTIQDAVDAVDATTLAGALVLVNRGVYATGGRAVYGLMTNRVAVDKPVMVRSLHGPTLTRIQGAQATGATFGAGAVRCVYLTDGAVLSGFTLAYGATRASGDATREQSGGGAWCESVNSLVTNCLFIGNAAPNGGGAFSGTLNNCTFTVNSAWNGGGAYQSTLNNCVFTGNSVRYVGGGVCYGTLNNCTLVGNLAPSGGGAYAAALTNCILYYHTTGGNYSGGTLNFCCTTPLPGGSGNIAAEPLFRDLLGGNLRLQPNSPCINLGANASAPDLADLDGRSRIVGGRVDMGAYEYHGPLYVSAASPNPLAPYSSWATAAQTIQEAVDLAVPGDEIVVTNGLYATGGRAVYGTMTNRVALTKPVSVRSANGPEVTFIEGYQVPATTNGDTAIRCVYLTNGAVLSGFTLTHGATRAAGDKYWNQSGGGVWCESTAARVVNCAIQRNAAQVYGGGAWSGTLEGCVLTGNTAAVGGGTFGGTLNDSTLTGNTAATGGGAVAGLLNHCTLRANTATTGGGVSGGTLRDCTLVGNTAATAGGGADSATLYGCVLTNNTATAGGGAWGGKLDHCVLVGNTASSTGGGVDSGTLNNCLLTGNVAPEGGGVASCALDNCTLAGNSASVSGGGASAGTLNNCILYYNTAVAGSNFAGGVLRYCCTTPDAGAGAGNITPDPLFVDRLNGNLRLQTNSPCLNAGANGPVASSTDLDGRPRIVGDTVDLGAYEVQDATTNRFVAWLSQHGFPIQVWSDSADMDGDGRNNWQEWVADTNPTNALSLLRLFPLTGGVSWVVVSWQSLTNRTYSVERSTNLGAAPPFQPLATGIIGQAGTTSYTDTNAPSAGPTFYRVVTQP